MAKGWPLNELQTEQFDRRVRILVVIAVRLGLKGLGFIKGYIKSRLKNLFRVRDVGPRDCIRLLHL